MDETLLDLEPASAAASFAPYAAVIVVGVILLIFIIAMAIVLRRYLGRPELHGMNRDEIRLRWEEIEKLAQTGLMGAKMSVVEADKLLDSALKSMTMPGETLGARLKFASYKYPELRKVWFAHKLRNQLVHETSFDLSLSQAKAALHEYKKALKVVHVI